MALLKNKDREYLQGEFSKRLKNPVRLVVFTQTIACDFCEQTEQIAEEVAGLSDLISVEVYNFVNDKSVADQYGVDKIPALVVASEKDYGIRFFGIPAGYEFTSLVEDIMMVSSGDSGLSAETKAAVAGVTAPVHIQVFVTPTCPYCPGAVLLAHKLAMESDKILGDMVEATEFPHLAQKYNVMGVPRSVINEKTHIEGAVPEAMLIAQLMESLGAETPMVQEAVPGAKN
ncbi:MAG TPA: glutaredoxin [Propionibacteriaceae bacterium]|nr:glutaredoxin [Propionibacteriaceae bacterium]